MRQSQARRPRTSETAFNFELARQLRLRHPRWREADAETDAVAAEQSGMLGGTAAVRLRPDIVVRHPGGLPVVVETEFAPARTVEAEAEARFGQTINGLEVEGVLAVRIPVRLAGLQTELGTAIANERFEFCLLTRSGPSVERWPRRGWLSGGVDQLVESVEHAALSETRLAEAVAALEEGIRDGAGLLRNHRTTRPDMFTQMGTILHQEDSVQTTRMAVAIIANAFVFQGAISGNHGIPSPEDLRNGHAQVQKTEVTDCWNAVLRVNYWPIFRLALDLLSTIPAAVAQRFLDVMLRLSTQLAGLGSASLHDLSGQMFQRLIADRKFLATFYTLPASATLLAELAVRRLPIDWSNSDAVGSLRIADLACGTGSLLAAARQSVARRHRRAGGDDRALHARMLEQVLIAADIMPAATHLTASTISSAHPGVTFAGTRIFTMPYGEEHGEVRIGSLELTLSNQTMSIFGTGDATRVGGRGEEINQFAVVEGGSCDLVIMNPPFTNPTNHEATDAPVPAFAGFGTAAQEQAAMSTRLTGIRRELERRSRIAGNGTRPEPYPAGHGNAGLASNFIDLAHAKLRVGGCLALVLPASFAQGAGWEHARRLLGEHYHDITIIGISSTGSTERAFSADTGMAEVLVIAVKSEPRREGEHSAIVANLQRRPRTLLEGSLVAEAVDAARRAGTPVGTLSLGEGIAVGSRLRMPSAIAGSAVGIRELALADSMICLAEGELGLPQAHRTVGVPMTRLAELGHRGALDRDINGTPPRGPFDINPLEPGDYPEFPALWGHDATRETSLLVAPDRYGLARPGCGERAAELWQRSASRLHMNRDFQLNSQPLAACLTERPSLGGTAWPNFVLDQETWEPAILLWANTSIGLMSFWWHGTRQQQGRSRVTISRLPELLTLDARQLDARQLECCAGMVDEFSRRQFLPANEAWRDTVRQELDRAVFTEILGHGNAVLDGLTLLREQWCREPSVHGGKGTRPEEA